MMDLGEIYQPYGLFNQMVKQIIKLCNTYYIEIFELF